LTYDPNYGNNRHLKLSHRLLDEGCRINSLLGIQRVYTHAAGLGEIAFSIGCGSIRRSMMQRTTKVGVDAAPFPLVVDRSQEHFLKTSEVATALRISSRTVRLWAECLVLPAVKIGKQWRFRPTDIAKVIADPSAISITASTLE
jgi:excisionase family DNA binding protein